MCVKLCVKSVSSYIKWQIISIISLDGQCHFSFSICARLKQQNRINSVDRVQSLSIVDWNVPARPLTKLRILQWAAASACCVFHVTIVYGGMRYGLPLHHDRTGLQMNNTWLRRTCTGVLHGFTYGSCTMQLNDTKSDASGMVLDPGGPA
jgi:hypothetical protein